MLLHQCYPNSAGSLVIARGTEWGPHCFCCFFCVVGYPPNWGKWPRYIDIDRQILTEKKYRTEPLAVLSAQDLGGRGGGERKKKKKSDVFVCAFFFFGLRNLG